MEKNAQAEARKKIARELNALKRDVTIDWIDRPDDERGLQTVAEAAIAKKDFDVLVKAYAAAIIAEGPSGAFDWKRIHDLTNAAWIFPNVDEVLKGRAWKVIARAKKRQKAQGSPETAPRVVKATPGDVGIPAGKKAVLGDAGRFVAFLVAGVLVFLGIRTVWTVVTTILERGN